jgi:hypothetical protein
MGWGLSSLPDAPEIVLSSYCSFHAFFFPVNSGIEFQQQFLKDRFKIRVKMAVRMRETLTEKSLLSSDIRFISVIFIFSD